MDRLHHTGLRVGLAHSHGAAHKTSWPLQLNCQSQATQLPLCHQYTKDTPSFHYPQALSSLAQQHTATAGWSPCISHLTEDQSAVCAYSKLESVLSKHQLPGGPVCLLDTIPLNTAQLPDHFTGDNHVLWASEMIQSDLIVNSGFKTL